MYIYLYIFIFVYTERDKEIERERERQREGGLNNSIRVPVPTRLKGSFERNYKLHRATHVVASRVYLFRFIVTGLKASIGL